MKRAKRIEKLVIGTSGGVSADTLRKAWESVTTSRGGRLSCSRACPSSRSLTTSAMASESMRSRIDCTCGRIRRPRGASLSIGTTSTAISPELTRSPRIDGLSMKSGGAASSSAWRKSSTPRPSLAAVSTGVSLSSSRRGTGAGCSLRSTLLKITTTGVLRSWNSSRMPSSNSPHEPASVTSTPRSVRSKTCIVRRARSSPSTPTSSMPAVSMKRTGPSGSSSIGFSTGSVVVPAKSLTIETSWRVIALSRLDLPTLRRPKMPMWRRIPRGASMSPISSPIAHPSRLRPSLSGMPRRQTASALSSSSNCSALSRPSLTTTSRIVRPRSWAARTTSLAAS